MTNQYLLAYITGRDANLRAGDADRERVAERLRKSHAEGRLDVAELQDRIERCYSARTLGQLSELVRDLPRQDEPDRRGRFGWSSLRWRLAPLVPLLFAVLVISAATGHHHAFWLWIPLLFVFWRLFSWRRRWFADPRRGPGEWI